ncbi:adenosylmethionine decarboxylase [Parasphingopyxis sp.]|uniref:adenosylmethionine decarboxylase n=1 Tax=Parasphingopyxis sp. TaxID=1920299 RepID=UPI0026207170|nr:adenosylmethionine decarboxylase [Parasphingopyxis sp.]
MTASPPLPYDGRHVLADFHGCTARLDDIGLVERALRAASDAAGATILDLNLHHFGDGQGVTGVALLAESHMSIHTWPEHDYAALDLFLCGRQHNIDAALAVLADGFAPADIAKRVIARGYGVAALVE